MRSWHPPRHERRCSREGHSAGALHHAHFIHAAASNIHPPVGCGRHIAHGPAAGGNDGTRRFFRLRRTCDGIGDGGGANSCRVHELFLFLMEGGYESVWQLRVMARNCVRPNTCSQYVVVATLKTEYPHRLYTPHYMHEYENKGVAKWVPRKCMKRKGGFFLGCGRGEFRNGNVSGDWGSFELWKV